MFITDAKFKHMEEVKEPSALVLPVISKHPSWPKIRDWELKFKTWGGPRTLLPFGIPFIDINPEADVV